MKSFLVSLDTLSKFRTCQWKVISKILNGEDVIAVIPTVGGKMVVYALPCTMKPNLRSGVPYIFCRGGKVRLIQLLEYLSAAP